jgi:cytochrome c-type biogenesis protein CcmH
VKLVILLVLVVLASPALAAPTDRDVDAVASELRCVVCQNLSVADSPSDMAKQMRDLVRERLAAGHTPAQVKAYFVERYGEWVLLSPPTTGFALFAWVAPFAVLLGGGGVACFLLYRWSRPAAPGAPDDDAVDADMLAAVRHELDRRKTG